MPDPRSGAIAKDAFLVTVKRADGTLISPEVQANFDCLKNTGDFCPGTTNTEN
jgi:hypothetical protein